MLGAWLAAASSAALWAEQPSTTGRAAVGSDSSSRTAVDRWRRLKSLYPIPEPAATAPTATKSAEVPRAAKVEAPIRLIPDEPVTDLEQPAPESNSTLTEPGPSRTVPESIESALPLPQRRPALPITPFDEEPAWIVPVEVEPEPEFTIDPNDDGGVHTLEPTHIVPAPVDESAALVRDAASQESASSARLAAKQISHAQVVPARNRRIGSINPFRSPTPDGRESDHDVREWARKQTGEPNLAFGTGPFPERAFPATVKPWEAPNFFNYPLYFEDPALERYGHSRHPLIQPIASIGRFSAQLVCLPYLMTLDPPCRDVYSLGWYRPGECAPKLHYQVPLNAQAAAVEAATITGLVFLIP